MKYKIYYRNRKDTIYLELSIPPEREVLISTGVKVAVKFWDSEKNEARRGYLNYENINLNLRTKYKNLEDILIKAQIDKKNVTAQQVKESITNKPLHNIFEFLNKYKEDLKGKRNDGTIENYRKHFLKLELFHGSKNLSFEDIDQGFLQRYENYLKSEGLSNNYIFILFRTVKQIFLAATKKKIIEINPFEDYERPKYKSPTKHFLTYAEINEIEDFAAKTKNKYYKEIAYWFLFSCYTGLRISDWLRFDEKKHVRDGFIEIFAQKNGQFITMPVSENLKRILNEIKELPITLTPKSVNKDIKKICALAGIKKHITAHSARHSFAITVCLGNKISSETSAKIMGITLQTFIENYSQVTQEKILRETKEAWGLK